MTLKTLLLFCFLLAVSLSQELIPDDSDMEPEQVEKEKLAFIERTLINVFQKAQLPELYHASNNKISMCGCTYGLRNVNWGTKVGMFCKRKAESWDESCGLRCESPRGEGIMLLCPNGWQALCAKGCMPPEDFTTIKERSDFLERNVDEVIKMAYDYLDISKDFEKSCGCTNAIGPIRYGSKTGLQCTFDEDMFEQDGGCQGYGGCVDEHENNVMIFCAAGHDPTCAGCKKQESELKGKRLNSMETRTYLDNRYDFMVNTLTGFVREAAVLLEMVPTTEKVLQCGCSSSLVPVNYGTRVGHTCLLNSVDDITADCGRNIVCENEDNNLVLHLCPDAFVPSCTQGCGYAWKKEL